MKTKTKVLAYIIRTSSEESASAPASRRHTSHPGNKVLVFLHRDFPEAELQVVGGTVDPGEDLIGALLREIYEEAGLTFTEKDIVKKIGETYYQRKDRPEMNHRHYYLIEKNDLPDSWAHTVHSEGEDNGMVFNFFWMEIAKARQELTGKMGELLP